MGLVKVLVLQLLVLLLAGTFKVQSQCKWHFTIASCHHK